MTSMSRQNRQRQKGFTLIEVMLVILIMAVMASLILMNISGIDQRRVLQAKETLLLDLQRIGMEAVDQGRVLGLVVLPATDAAPAVYQVWEYKLQATANQADTSSNNFAQQNHYKWQVAPDFQPRTLPEHSALQIQALAPPELSLAALKQANSRLPELIWFGNGESIAVRLQLYLQQQAVGDAIELNTLGQLVTEENR